MTNENWPPKTKVGDIVQIGACVGQIIAMDGDTITDFKLHYINISASDHIDEYGVRIPAHVWEGMIREKFPSSGV